MNGKLGSLHIGKLNIGGFLNWQVDLTLSDNTRHAETYYKLAKWKLSAQSYWLYDTPTKVMVRLYSGKGFWEGKGQVTSQTRKILDTLIHEELTIIGEGILEGHE
jgi:hypothetical protein